MVEVTPEVPSSTLSLRPIPVVPGRNGSLVHVGHIVTVVKLRKFGVRTEVALAEVVSNFVGANIISPNGDGDLKHSSSPAIVISSVNYSEGSVLDCDFVEGALETLGEGQAQDGESFIAELISFEGVAVVTAEPASPIVFGIGEDGCLEGESLLDGFETELVDVGNATVRHALHHRCEQHCRECQLIALHFYIVIIMPGKKLLRLNKTVQIGTKPQREAFLVSSYSRVSFDFLKISQPRLPQSQNPHHQLNHPLPCLLKIVDEWAAAMPLHPAVGCNSEYPWKQAQWGVRRTSGWYLSSNFAPF